MPKIRFVTSLGCTPCLRIKRILRELQADMPNLTVEEVEFTSPVGTKLAIARGIGPGRAAGEADSSRAEETC